METDKTFESPIRSNGRFYNPVSFVNWKGVPGILDVINWKLGRLGRDESALPSAAQIAHALPIKKPNFGQKTQLAATWLGHATVLVTLDEANFITDPVFSMRAAPFNQNWFGPRRYVNPPCSILELPKLHFGVISHNHYDHLDWNAVRQISDLNVNMTWFVPLGLKNWMESTVSDTDFCGEIIELNWGQSWQFSHPNTNQKFTILCTPAQHWSQRYIFDRFKTLWSGWAVMGPKSRFFYSGDTGFCEDEFRKLGEKYGPFDLAAIPIGCYCPRDFMKSQHINPEEAVLIHKLIKSRHTMGIHWGTYQMGSNEHYLEPAKLFRQAAEKYNYSNDEVFTVGHGETRFIFDD